MQRSFKFRRARRQPLCAGTDLTLAAPTATAAAAAAASPATAAAADVADAAAPADSPAAAAAAASPATLPTATADQGGRVRRRAQFWGGRVRRRAQFGALDARAALEEINELALLDDVLVIAIVVAAREHVAKWLRTVDREEDGGGARGVDRVGIPEELIDEPL